MYAVLNTQGKERLAEGVCRLDRAHREGRSAAGAATAQGDRAQSGGDVVGRGRRPFLHARRDFDRQESPDRQCQRSRVCGVGRPRTAGRARSERAQHLLAGHSDTGAERESTVAVPRAEPSVAALGQRAPLGQSAVQPGRSAQPDDRQQGPRVDDGEDSQQSGSVRGAATRRTSSRSGSRFRAAVGRPRSTIGRRRSSR